MIEAVRRLRGTVYVVRVLHPVAPDRADSPILASSEVDAENAMQALSLLVWGSVRSAALHAGSPVVAVGAGMAEVRIRARDRSGRGAREIVAEIERFLPSGVAVSVSRAALFSWR